MTEVNCTVSIQVVQWTKRQTGEARQAIRDCFDEIEDLLTLEDTWKDPEQALNSMYPLLALLRLFDGDTPCLGKVILYCERLCKYLLVVSMHPMAWLTRYG